MVQNFCNMNHVVELLGIQLSQSSENELHFGKRGSLSVNLKSDMWYDHEHMQRGGILYFVIFQGKASDNINAAKFLYENGLVANTDQPPKSKPILRSHIYRNEHGKPTHKATKYENGR